MVRGLIEQPRADLGVRQLVTGEPRHLRLVGGKVVARLDGAFARALAGRQQVPLGAPPPMLASMSCPVRSLQPPVLAPAAPRRIAGAHVRARRACGWGPAARSPPGTAGRPRQRRSTAPRALSTRGAARARRRCPGVVPRGSARVTLARPVRLAAPGRRADPESPRGWALRRCGLHPATKR